MSTYDPQVHDAWLESGNPDDQPESTDEARQDFYNEW
jgi:hypothetical protein